MHIKVKFLIILSTLVCAVIFALPAQALDQLKIGDNFRQYLKDHPIKYKIQAPTKSDWPERNIFFGVFEKPRNPKNPAFLLSQGKIPFGVMQGAEGQTYFLYDTDGDSILDFKTEKNLLPPWVIINTVKNKDKSTNNLKEILDLMYETHKSKEGHADKTKIIKAGELILKEAKDPQRPNRDLIYLINYYLNVMQFSPKLAIKTMEILDRMYKERFGADHPLIVLYWMESHINADQRDEARQLNKRLRQMDPNFVPAIFYQYKLEDDPAIANKLKNKLLQDHKDHWIVRNI